MDDDSDAAWTRWSPSGRMVRDVALTLLVAILVGYGWHFLQFDNPNERSRIYLTVAMVDHGQVIVDKQIDRWGDIYDLAEYEGHWYSNKPPGSSLLAATLYAPIRWVAPDTEWSDRGLMLLFRFGLMLPLSLLGFVVMRRWLRMLDLSEPSVDLASIAWILGSSAFHYAGAFFSHQIVAVCFVVGGYLVHRTHREVDRGEATVDDENLHLSARMLLAGLAFGLAGATEYQAGVASLFFALYVVAIPALRSRRLLVPFGAGAALFVLVLIAYHHAAFGGPLDLSYFYHRDGGVGRIGLPVWEYTKGVLVSPHRGLLITNPWMALVVPGAWYLFRRGETYRGIAVVLFASFLFRLFFLFGYNNWHGSWSFGLRHLVPQMGLMTVLCAATTDEWLESAIGSFVVRSTIVVGIVYNQVMDAFNAVIPQTTSNPIMDMIWPMYQNGIPTPNIVQVLTPLEGLATLIPLAILVAGTIAFVMGRGLTRVPGTIRRVAVAGLTLVPTVALAFWLHGLGHDWSEKARNDWSGWIQNWHDKDRRFHGLDDSSD